MKIKGLFIICILLLAGLGVSFADDGKYNNNQVILNENGTNETYDVICIDKENTISNGAKVSTKNNITTREGALEYLVDNWSRNMTSTEKDTLQEGVWNITENETKDSVSYVDKYLKNKSNSSLNITTIESINGSNWTVNRWTTSFDEFIFRMTGDTWNQKGGQQDLLIWLVNSYDLDFADFELIPPVVIPNNTTNETNITEPPIDGPVLPPKVNETNDTPIIVKPNPVPVEEMNEIVKVVNNKIPMESTAIPVAILLVIMLVSAVFVGRKK